jgi:hypothetical protein
MEILKSRSIDEQMKQSRRKDTKKGRRRNSLMATMIQRQHHIVAVPRPARPGLGSSIATTQSLPFRGSRGKRFFFARRRRLTIKEDVAANFMCRAHQCEQSLSRTIVKNRIARDVVSGILRGDG